jgi:hypothetical protein
MGMLDGLLMPMMPPGYVPPGGMPPSMAVPLPRPAPGMAPPLPPAINVPGMLTGNDFGQAAPPASAPAAAPAPDSSSVPSGSLIDRLLGKTGNFIDNNRMALMALGAGMAGAQNLGQGLNRGMTMALPAMQADIAQQNQNASYQAIKSRLIAQGMSEGDAHSTALAARGNPQLMAQLLPGLFGLKQEQFTQIGEDYLGNKRFGWVNPFTKTVTPLQGSAAGASMPTGPDGEPLQGQELLQHLEKSSNPDDQVTAAGIKGLLAGNLNANPRQLQRLAPLASLVDPTFNMATFPARQALQKSYLGGGKDFQETQALNTVAGHMSKLADAVDKLDPSDWNLVNKARNWWSDSTFGKTNPNLSNLRTVLTTTNTDLAKAYHGGHVTDAAYGAFHAAMNEDQTGPGMKAAIGAMGDLLQSKIQAKESGWRQGMGQVPIPSEFKAINDEAAASFDKISNWAHGQTAQGAAPASGSKPPSSLITGGATAPLARMSSPADAMKLPPGTHFLDANGVERVRP